MIPRCCETCEHYQEGQNRCNIGYFQGDETWDWGLHCGEYKLPERKPLVIWYPLGVNSEAV